jgi:large-conductance mechanosensitive channel
MRWNSCHPDGPQKRVSIVLASKKNLHSYRQMLDTKDIIILTAAVYLGGVVGRFFTALTDGIIAPLLAPLGGKDLAESVVSVGGVTLKTGELIASTIQLMISFALVVYMIGILRTYYLSKIGAGGGR